MTMVVIIMIIGTMKMGITIDGDKNNNNVYIMYTSILIYNNNHTYDKNNNNVYIMYNMIIVYTIDS